MPPTMSHAAELPQVAPLTPTDGALSAALAYDDTRAALATLAYNLRWSWDAPTVGLFASLAPSAWNATHNPVAVVEALAQDAAPLTTPRGRILEQQQNLAAYLARRPRLLGVPRIAYLSAEFAIAECLPIYAGGLGVLAGDHLKAASDLGLPLVGVGLLYRYGYFRQTLDGAGCQQEQYDHLDTDTVPLTPVLGPDGAQVTVGIPFPGRMVLARAWLAQVGRVPLYLLDTELPENREDDRWITGHLYGGDQDTRIRQEMVLGVGGARLLRALLPADRQPEVFHMNEGHSAFIALELARERVAAGVATSFEEGLRQGAPSLIFTTHTPVAAGHDAFPSSLVEAYFADYRRDLGLSHEQLMRFGRRDPDDATERFSMTVLALHSADRRNGVSQLHGSVSRQMWAGVRLSPGELPPADEMDAITNAVHTATWAGPEMSALFDARLGPAWRSAPDEPASWSALSDGEPAALWSARTAQRARLLDRVDASAGLAQGVSAETALVIGFARRFATYKRAGLLLADPGRLERLLRGPRPVVIVFSGKAHPRDDPGKALLQSIVAASRDERFRGHIVFLENYDVELGRLLVQGSDVWLNTPRRPLEASGTSGMKAVLNGALHVSELDGWWDEAYQPDLGWALGAGIPRDVSAEDQDATEAHQLMTLLEGDVTPLFFDRDAAGVPVDWLRRVTESMRVLAPRFSAQRMVSEYAERLYVPAGDAAHGSSTSAPTGKV